MKCDWCERNDATALGAVSWRSSRQAAAVVSLVLCHTCAGLLVPELVAVDPEDAYEAEAEAVDAVDAQLGRVYAGDEQPRDRCWWCSRDAAPLPSTLSEGGRLVFEDPVVCDICAALAGHAPYGFADADERKRDAVEQVFEMLIGRTQPVGSRVLRGRADELIIAKLALLGVDFPDDDFCSPGRYLELAGSLALSIEETKAEITRLRNQPEAPVTFYRVDGVVSPTLSPRGQLRLRALLREFRVGPPYASAALGSAPLRKTLAQLDGAAIST
jgi:hypothetical protein